MAKTALIQKANRKPKFAVRAYTRCQRCGRPHSVYRKFGLCRICLREMAHKGELLRRRSARKPRRGRATGPLMTMTDPIADMLTRLRNANQAHHDSVSMPSSKLKVNIASILKSEGYIADYAVVDAEVGKTLTLSLKYGANRQRAIQGVRRISKPGLRVYAKSTNLPKVLGGLGVATLSTSSGLLTDKQAENKGVGGEVLAYIW